jgi:tRNA dimethylallyltransferase
MTETPFPPLTAQAPLVVILGPTAVGKTEIALQLAERLNGEIVSADSRLFYRGMDIGVARPSPAEMQRVRHHLINIAKPDETWSLAMFQQRAHQAIAGIHARQRLPFLVGGTGQYVHAVIHGWTPPAIQPDPRLRAALETWAAEIGKDGLHARLALLDPAAASAIDARNLRRTVRALEVILSSGRRFSEQRQAHPSPYRYLQIGLQRPRPELYARIDQRIEAMLQAGWVAEVQDLLGRGFSPDLPSLSAIGYRQIVAYLHGHMDYEQAVAEIRRATRVFVRRQANWFKPNDPQIRWYSVHPGLIFELTAYIQTWLIEKGLESSKNI